MFCPKCRAEYKKGIVMCRDCDVDLVEKLPPEPEPEWIEFEEVLSTYNLGDIAIIKSILDGAGMKYYFQNENFAHVSPFVTPARLMVPKNQVEKTLELLKDMKLAFMGVSQLQGEECAPDESAEGEEEDRGKNEEGREDDEDEEEDA